MTIENSPLRQPNTNETWGIMKSQNKATIIFIFRNRARNSNDSPACHRMLLSEGSRSVVNELRSGKYQLELSKFEAVWSEFDSEGAGRIKVDDVDSCVRRILSAVNISSFTPYQ